MPPISVGETTLIDAPCSLLRYKPKFNKIFDLPVGYKKSEAI
jgi:hypothetical protein